jgi:hypothetical protein
MSRCATGTPAAARGERRESGCGSLRNPGQRAFGRHDKQSTAVQRIDPNARQASPDRVCPTRLRHVSVAQVVRPERALDSFARTVRALQIAIDVRSGPCNRDRVRTLSWRIIAVPGKPEAGLLGAVRIEGHPRRDERQIRESVSGPALHAVPCGGAEPEQRLDLRRRAGQLPKVRKAAGDVDRAAQRRRTSGGHGRVYVRRERHLVGRNVRMRSEEGQHTEFTAQGFLHGGMPSAL